MYNHYKSLDDFIKNYKSNIVHFTFCNRGGVKLAINLAKSCKKAKIPLIFFGLDRESLKELSKHCSTVNNIDDNIYRFNISRNFTSNQAKFNSNAFAKLMWIKYEICKAILNSNRNLVHLDIDIVVKKNYTNNLLNYFKKDKNLDALFMADPNDGLNAGFFSINKNAKDKFFNIYSEEFLSKNNYKKLKMMDQEFLNKVVDNKRKKLLNIKPLPSKYYPVGIFWYTNYSKIKKDAKLVHYNYLIGDFNKIIRMMKYRDYYYQSIIELSNIYLLFFLSKIKFKIIKLVRSIKNLV